LIDSHCHLTDPRLLEQLEAVLSRAKQVGVERMISIGTEVHDARDAILLCSKHPDRLKCGIGIHPNYCHEASLDDVKTLHELQNSPHVVALGEMGLDYHYSYAPRERQRQFFEAQLALADELKRKVIIHCRQAVDDALAVLRGFATTAVFHCFTGTPAEAEAILAAGHWISYTGAITFRKNDGLRDCVRLTPRDRLMVETDAPYLSPEPFRSQKTNEPSLVVHTAAVVAQVWGVSPAEVDRITTDNVKRFFGFS
jgi:TatD DNase family protein